MRLPSVAMAVAFVVSAFVASPTQAAEQKANNAKKSDGSSTGLQIAKAAESAGAKLELKAAGGNGGPEASNAGGRSAVPPGKRCDPNDPRPGCQPLPKASPKK